MAEARHTKVLIIGSGPAGYTAGVYASRAMLEPILVQGIEPGGQLTTTTDVENYPGFTEVQGPDLMIKMQEHAAAMGCEIIGDIISDLDLSNRPFTAKGDSGTIYTADAVILATGARAKWLGLASEEKFKGFGVSACATCDGFFYRGQEIVVIGGGNTAVEEALFLTNFASKVTLIHRRDELRASKIMQDRALNHPKVEFLWNTQVTKMLGSREDGIHAVRTLDTVTGEEGEFACQGVFVAIGHTPNTSVFGDALAKDDAGYLVVEEPSSRTALEGVFACGDVVDSIYRQAVTAAGSGCKAAIDAERFLAERE